MTIPLAMQFNPVGDMNRAMQQGQQIRASREQFAQAKMAKDRDLLGRVALSVKNASPEQKHLAWKAGLQVLDQNNVPREGIPTEYSNDAGALVDTYLNTSTVQDKERDIQFKSQSDIEKARQLQDMKMDVARAGATSVNVGGGNFGKKGKDLIEKLTIEEKFEAKKERKRDRQAAVVAATVVRDSDRALKILNKSGGLAAGWGSMLDVLPGSAAKTLKGHIDSMKSNIGLDRLVKLKSSGTGLGAIPQSQMDMLSSTMGNLDTSQGVDDLKENITRAKIIYKATKENRPLNPEEFKAMKMEMPEGFFEEVEEVKNIRAEIPESYYGDAPKKMKKKKTLTASELWDSL